MKKHWYIISVSALLVVVAIVILALFVFGVDEVARVVIRLVAVGQA